MLVIIIMGVIVNSLRYLLGAWSWPGMGLVVCTVLTAYLVWILIVRKFPKSAPVLTKEHLNNLKPRHNVKPQEMKERKEAADVEEDEDDEDEVPAIPEDTKHVPYRPTSYDDEVMIQRSRDFYEEMNKRRSVRFFSEKPVTEAVVENLVRTAGMMMMMMLMMVMMMMTMMIMLMMMMMIMIRRGHLIFIFLIRFFQKTLSSR